MPALPANSSQHRNFLQAKREQSYVCNDKNTIIQCTTQLVILVCQKKLPTSIPGHIVLRGKGERKPGKPGIKMSLQSHQLLLIYSRFPGIVGDFKMAATSSLFWSTDLCFILTTRT